MKEKPKWGIFMLVAGMSTEYRLMVVVSSQHDGLAADQTALYSRRLD